MKGPHSGYEGVNAPAKGDVSLIYKSHQIRPFPAKRWIGFQSSFASQNRGRRRWYIGNHQRKPIEAVVSLHAFCPLGISSDNKICAFYRPFFQHIEEAIARGL